MMVNFVWITFKIGSCVDVTLILSVCLVVFYYGDDDRVNADDYIGAS